MPSLLERIADNLQRLVDSQTAGPSRWLTVEAAATYAALSPKSVRRLLESGKLDAHRPTDKILIDRAQLDALIEGATVRRRSGRGKRVAS